jgi:hypothetical protein
MNLVTTNNQGFAPVTLDEAMRFSEMLAKSSMVPKQYQNKPEDVLVAVQWGKELGLAPLQALQNIACINGKPSVYGDAALALVQASPLCEGIEERMEGEGTPNPQAVCVAHRKGRKPVVATFSVEDAKRAGLWGKQGPWTSYPKRMLAMRARGFALRDAFPDVLKGLISAEEAQDYPDEAKPQPVAKPANPLDLVAKPEPVAIESVEVVLEAEPQPAEAELLQPADTVARFGYALMVPGKEEAFSVHESLDEWQDAYEDLADKTARAGKRPARERMTALKELRVVNEDTIARIDMVKRIRHTASYTQRIKALGASQG